MQTVTVYALHLPLGFLGMMLWGFFDTGGPTYWRIAYASQIIPQILFIVLALTVYRNFESPVLMLKANKEIACKQFMGRYMKEEYIIF